MLGSHKQYLFYYPYPQELLAFFRLQNLVTWNYLFILFTILWCSGIQRGLSWTVLAWGLSCGHSEMSVRAVDSWTLTGLGFQEGSSARRLLMLLVGNSAGLSIKCPHMASSVWDSPRRWTSYMVLTTQGSAYRHSSKTGEAAPLLLAFYF